MSKEIIGQKELAVNAIKEKVQKAKSVVVVDYRGLTVLQDTVLRADLRKANVEYKVLKNRLVLRAFDSLGFKGFDEILQGPTAVAFGYDDAIAPAKILAEVAVKSNKLKVKGGIIENKKATDKEVIAFSKIPAKPILVAQLLGMLQSPIRSLAVALSEIAKKAN